LGIGLLFGARRRHLADLLLSDHAGGMLARRLLPATLLAVPMLGWLHLWAQRHTQITLQPGTALFVLAVVFMITAIIVSTARAIDIFDRKRILAEDALRNQEKLAATGRMAATMAHEINNPLEAVVNLVYLLESDTQLSDKSREYLTLAQQELERVAHITKQTLAFYRESSSPEPVDLVVVAREIISLLQRRIENKGARVPLSNDGPSTIHAVKGEIRQVLSNILTNSLDALPSSGGTIDIRIGSAQDLVTIEITDNGCGIPPEIQGKIFDPFYTTKKEFGTGLGLWVTRQLVEKNRGTIAFRSDRQDEDHGQTSFFVSFPAHAPHVVTAVSPPPVAVKSRSTPAGSAPATPSRP
jgi:signal transduction histidine kinase